MLIEKDKICILGKGGMAREVFLIIKDNLKGKEIEIEKLCFFLVKDDEYDPNEKILGINCIPESEFNSELYELVIAVGDCRLREKIKNKFPDSTVYPKIISKYAVVSEYASIGKGAIICPGTIITCDVEIGEFVIINLNVTISHDSKVGNFSTIAPGVNINGNCLLKDGVYVGSSVAVKQGVSICNDVIIGMGAVVVKDISSTGTYIGNPLKKLK